MLTNKSVQSDTLCETIKRLIAHREFASAEKSIAAAMSTNPHDAEPHNLMGILLEHENKHCAAMKHFRAAWALEPNFRQAQINMDNYGGFDGGRFFDDAYDENDCNDKDVENEDYKNQGDDTCFGE